MMSKVDDLQSRHDDLISQIEMEIRNQIGNVAVQESLIRMVNQYGNTCIKLVEAEHAECANYGDSENY